MKRERAFALLLAALALVFAVAATGASGEGSDYFTATNETVLALDPETMPFSRDGEYYVPYTVFSDRSLGVYYSYNQERYTLTLYNKDYTLTFDSPAQVAYDRSEQYKIKLAANSAGTICVPIGFVCERFGLDFQVIRTHPVQTLRIASSGAKSADDFKTEHQPELVAMYLDYISPEPSPSASLAPSAAPSTVPRVSAAPSPSVEPSLEPTPEPRVVYITFDDGPNSHTDDILDTLDAHDMKATFFLTGSLIGERRDTVRRMAGEGHSIGLHAWSHVESEMYSSTDALLDELERANGALDAVTQTKSRLFRFPYGSAYSGVTQDMRDAVIGAGYRYWDWTVDALDYEQPSASALANHVIDGLERSDSTAVILMHDTEYTAEALDRILDYIEKGNFIVRTITIGELPQNFYSDVRTSLSDD